MLTRLRRLWWFDLTAWARVSWQELRGTRCAVSCALTVLSVCSLGGLCHHTQGQLCLQLAALVSVHLLWALPCIPCSSRLAGTQCRRERRGLTIQVTRGRVGEQGVKRSPRAAAEARQPACWSALLESHGGVLPRHLSLKKCWRTPNVETEMKPNPMSLDLKISALCVCSSVRHLGGYRVIYRVIFGNNFAMQTVNIAEYLMLFLDQTS